MGSIASQITNLAIVYSIVYSDADQRKHQSSASLAFVRGIHRGPVNSPHKWPVTREMFPFDDVIMRVTLYARLTLIVVSRRPSQTTRTQRLNNTGCIHLCGILIDNNCLLSYQQVHILSDRGWWLISRIPSLIMTMGCQNLAGLA